MKKQKVMLKKLSIHKGTIAALTDNLQEGAKGGASGTGWGCKGPSYCEWSKPPECTQPTQLCPVTVNLCGPSVDIICIP
ncbi:class I lanthipeptide [Taibaiella chishuiensis]|uniref:Uncharacterized protein n=1 Tax=Taibaiella chishuiensis TaxID=1434707 RepID=A0A2P8CWW1_9BACT|nr:class I lanthipeptide [Taibaiella chishuiensis]PSK89458.1 hypothetical protein B0I18_11110 [Taibaiella chishuiensis]